MTTPAPHPPLRLEPVAAWPDAVERVLSRSARVGLDAVRRDLTRSARRGRAPGRSVTRSWRFDDADQRDLRWWPQGVSVEGDGLALVSWYAKKRRGDAVNHGSRITVLDLGSGRYRHVLLVRPDHDGTPRPLEVHAGGIASVGGHLHVAATGRGLFTARLDDVVRLRDDERDVAHGYRYLLPVHRQFRSTKDESGAHFRFSFLSHDAAATTSESGALVAGEYTDDPAGTRRIARFPLGRDGLPSSADAVLLGGGVRRMQGVAALAGGLRVTVSQGPVVPGSLASGAAGALRQRRLATPMGCEDLTVDPTTGGLWSVSEHPFARWLFALDPR